MKEEAKVYKGFWPVLAFISTGVGAFASWYFMSRVGSHQKSILLSGLFTVWVLSPYIGLLWAYQLSSRWPTPVRTTILIFMWIIPLISLIVYSGVLGLSPAKPAFPYMATPLASWLLMLVAGLVSGKISQRRKGTTPPSI